VDLSIGKVAQLDINLVPRAWMKTNQTIARQKPDPFPLPPRKNADVSQACLNQNMGEKIPKPSDALIFSQHGSLYRFTSPPGITEIARSDSGYLDGDVSPNRKSLVYWYWDDEVGNRYWLYELNEMPKEFQQNSQFSLLGSSGRWRSNEEIWVSNDGQLDSLFNPFTQKFQELPDFPTQKTTDTLEVCPYGYVCAINYAGFQPYDNAAELWVYAFEGGFDLVNKEENILWKYRNPLAGFNLPKWQPGDQKLGVPLPENDRDVLGEHYEIFTIDRAGRQRQLTNYALAYPTMIIHKFAWSPDGRYIAFWGDTHSKERIAQQNPYRLFVLDTVTHHTIDYCVPGGYPSQFSQSYNPAPIWSPDGSQIAVQGIQSGKRMIMLVDFASGTVSPVTDGELIGWMANP
jgi:hypothetical protein